MTCTCDQRNGARSWATRLRVFAAIISIFAGLPGAILAIFFFTHVWVGPPSQEPIPRKVIEDRARPGPGRCPAYHVYRAGRCHDVRH